MSRGDKIIIHKMLKFILELLIAYISWKVGKVSSTGVISVLDRTVRDMKELEKGIFDWIDEK